VPASNLSGGFGDGRNRNKGSLIVLNLPVHLPRVPRSRRQRSRPTAHANHRAEIAIRRRKPSVRQATDLSQRIGPSLRRGNVRGPDAHMRIAPRMMAEKRDLRRSEPIAGQIEQIEVLQSIGTDHPFRRLNLLACLRWHKFGRDFGR